MIYLIPLTDSQAWCLAQFLPLLVGDLLPEGMSIWRTSSTSPQLWTMCSFLLQAKPRQCTSALWSRTTLWSFNGYINIDPLLQKCTTWYTSFPGFQIWKNGSCYQQLQECGEVFGNTDGLKLHLGNIKDLHRGSDNYTYYILRGGLKVTASSIFIVQHRCSTVNECGCTVLNKLNCSESTSHWLVN